MRYVPSFDGIRGIAVLMVLFFHYGYLHVGWMGVQVFFTLSGYLITSILLADAERPFPAFIGRFYWRRVLRILPLYVLFVAAAGLGHALLGEPASFPADWPYLVTYTANFARMREVDVGPFFVHIWSLAVEEQFYLIWPLVVFFLPRPVFKRVVIAILVLSPVVRFGLFLLLRRTGYDAEAAGRLVYVLPFTQFDAFAAGAAVTLWNLETLSGAGLKLLASAATVAVSGLATLLAAHVLAGGTDLWAFGYPMYMLGSYQYVWGYSLLNLLSALLIICAAQQVGPARLLLRPALVRVGKVSYGVYVYHVPVLILFELAAGRWGLAWSAGTRALLFLPYLAAVLLVSEASFRWLEAPFLRLKDLWSRRGDRAVREVAS